ncbi:hypothetical protein [Streptomyces sp. NPDC015131]|uniref:hypothetical protein n=1 Tax=Streptomyces sp. NPDC015131 TaxID=3364941 RepID=UPI0037009FF5
MNSDASPRRPAPHRPVLRHPALQRPALRRAARTGAALAGVLLPLTAAVLLAKAMAGDPLAPVNTLMTTGSQRVRVSPAAWRGCGRGALSAGRAARRRRVRTPVA